MKNLIKSTIGAVAMLLFGSMATAQTPAMLKDVLADVNTNYYVPYIEINGKIFYAINGGELWVTNGTTSGTIQLKNWSSDYISTFHEYNGMLLLFADSDNNGTAELWKSDGTVNGTVQVKNVLHNRTNSPVVPYYEVNNKVFYVINLDELWVTDATTSGTLQLKNWSSSHMTNLHELNNQLLFFGDSDNNGTSEIWKSDGTVNGTVQVKNVLNNYSTVPFVPYIYNGSKVYYEINLDELWVTDGTTGGTLQLKNWSSNAMSDFHILGSNVLFFADSDNNSSYELWKTDGTVNGTVQVKNVLHAHANVPSVPMHIQTNRIFYVVNLDELWVTDGTASGTLQLKNWACQYVGTFHELMGTFMFFTDQDNNGTSELWKSDGTVNGTVQVKNVLHNDNISPWVPYVISGNKVFYEVNLDELWVTDGTTSGTLQLKNWSSQFMAEFHVLGGVVLFFADSDNNGSNELWKSDGTVNGTVQVKNTLNNNNLGQAIPYFHAGTKVFYDLNGGEVWVTDASTAGTLLLKNFTNDYMMQYHGLASTLLFFGDDNNNSKYELWNVPNSIAASVNPQLNVQFRMYPVPATDFLNLEVSGLDESVEYQVIDLAGRTLITGKSMGEISRLDVSSLVAGTYLLRINAGEYSSAKKFIKN